VDAAAAVAAHAAAADLEAAQAALLRRLLGTYALKAYKGEWGEAWSSCGVQN
jgi:hypothetical protein